MITPTIIEQAFCDDADYENYKHEVEYPELARAAYEAWESYQQNAD